MNPKKEPVTMSTASALLVDVALAASATYPELKTEEWF